MEAVGQIILGLHRNLEEIRASLNANAKTQGSHEAALLQGTLDRAEAALRAQAREFCAAAAMGGGGLTAMAGGPPIGQLPAALVALRSPGPAPPPPMRSPSAPSAVRTAPLARSDSAGAGSGRPRRQRPLRPPSRGTRQRSKTSAPQRMLPRPNRLDPLADAPTLTEQDLEGGLFNLANRGFIPPAADLTPAMERGMPVMVQRPAPLYDQTLRHARREIAVADDWLSSAKLDYSAPVRFPRPASEERPAGNRAPASPGRFHSTARSLPPLPAAPPLPGAGAVATTTLALALPALPPPPPARGPHTEGGAEQFGTFCTELQDEGGPQPAEAAAAARARDLGMVRAAAAVCVQAHWRGLAQRRRFREMLVADRAARRIQSRWAASLTRMITKTELHRINEEGRQLHSRLRDELGQDWFQSKQMRRVEVHISSLSLAEPRRGHMESYQALQAAQVARIFRLADPKRDVIFVAPRALHEDILDYYAKIMQFRGIKNPPGRFQVVVPEFMSLNPNLSLSQGLLCSPKALRRIRKLVSGRQAYIVPEVVTHTELKLCAELRVPVLGPGPRNMALLGSKSHGKKLAQLADLPIGPWAVDIYDEDEFFTSLAGLVLKHPSVRTWLFKIDDDRDGRGLAYIDLAKIREVGDTLQRTMAEQGLGPYAKVAEGDEDDLSDLATAATSRQEANEEPAVLGADATELRQLLRRNVPKRACLCNRGAYPDFAAWMAEASRVGAVIQAVPESIISQTSVHIQIEPDGSPSVIGSSEAVMSQPFVRTASYFPHTRGSWEVLHEVGMRMGRVLASQGVTGFASVDVVFFENPGFDPARLLDEDREPTPLIIGGDTPVDPRHLMFADLRSPSPEMSTISDDRPSSASPQMPISLPESRQADYDLALQLKEMEPRRRSRDPLSMMLESPPHPASRFACWVVDVDVRLTDEACAIFPLQFMAQVRLDPSTGHFRLAPGAATEAAAEGAPAPAGPAAAAPAAEQEDPERSRRWALVSHVATAPRLNMLSHQTLFQAAKMRGVSFDLFHNIGCVFVFLDIVHSMFSLLTVDRSPENCAKRLSGAVAALSEAAAQGNGASRGKVAASTRDAPRLLGRDADMPDCLTVADVQLGLRTVQKRWTEKPRPF